MITPNYHLFISVLSDRKKKLYNIIAMCCFAKLLSFCYALLLKYAGISDYAHSWVFFIMSLKIIY